MVFTIPVHLPKYTNIGGSRGSMCSPGGVTVTVHLPKDTNIGGSRGGMAHPGNGYYACPFT